jgi:hypothetical protein
MEIYDVCNNINIYIFKKKITYSNKHETKIMEIYDMSNNINIDLKNVPLCFGKKRIEFRGFLYGLSLLFLLFFPIHKLGL